MKQLETTKDLQAVSEALAHDIATPDISRQDWVVWQDELYSKPNKPIFWLRPADSAEGTKSYSAEGFIKHLNIAFNSHDNQLTQAEAELTARMLENRWKEATSYAANTLLAAS